MLVLPKEKNKPKVNNPRFLILYDKTKSDKTTIEAAIDSNLIIDLKGGSEYI